MYPIDQELQWPTISECNLTNKTCHFSALQTRENKKLLVNFQNANKQQTQPKYLLTTYEWNKKSCGLMNVCVYYYYCLPFTMIISSCSS